MVYQIIKFNKTADHYELKGSDGRTYRADLFVDASFKDYPSGTISEQTGISKEDVDNEIIGKFVEIDELIPYEYIASGVSLIPSPSK